jgi:ABC-type transport system involved in multi-copper enzyme maturation permease subunit
MWSTDLARTKKQELKMRNPYYRIVKQGSQAVYLTFHVTTILAIMLSTLLRRSFIAILYVFILLPHLRTATDVFAMALFSQEKKRKQLE